MTPCWLLVLLCSSPLWQTEGVEGWGLSTVPSESECRPYIEKALKDLSPETPQEAVDATGSEHETPPTPLADQEGSIEETEEATAKESTEGETSDEAQTQPEDDSAEAADTSTEDALKEESDTAEETSTEETAESTEATEDGAPDTNLGGEAEGEESLETDETKEETDKDQQSIEEKDESSEAGENADNENVDVSKEDADETEGEQSAETPDEDTTQEKTEEAEAESTEETPESTEEEDEPVAEGGEQQEETDVDEPTAEEVSAEETQEEAQETDISEEKAESIEDTISSKEEHAGSEEEADNTGGEVTDSAENTDSTETQEAETAESTEAGAGEELTESEEETAKITEESKEDAVPASEEEPSETPADNTEEGSVEETAEETKESKEVTTDTPSEEQQDKTEASEEAAAEEQSVEDTPEEAEVANDTIEATQTSEEATESEQETTEESTEQATEQEQPAEEGEPAKEAEPTVEDQLTLEFETPKIRRQREHIGEILKLTTDSAEVEMLLAKTIEVTLKDLKKLYDSAIKPLEILYKYRDLSNRHFGDPEIFSKPLILFMGPWSGGKSTIINYLLDNEFQTSSLRTGAEPSPAYFNILMWGEREEVLDGTQLAADWTFSGLQKFGQGMLDRLRGLKLNNPLLEKVNIVEIPGILEIRKQVERLFPFNDACQWFIDRADIIFLVYDPSKLDVGPETEAILDQLKGREYQTRILLNKADQVKPEELMRVQGTLIWNISPLMSSQEPPILYSTSLWSVPYEQGAPTRLLHAQERAFLRDLRIAIDKRVENKIASARRFAVRVRNHAKMVDCYLTTYYNHKTFFGNRKKVAEDIIEHPQNYHIYEGLSTLTNISRYDLPDPEVYRDFFRLNPVYDFQRLSDTCTYFRGCPINRLDVAIAYDLPELVGKYKKQAEQVLETAQAQAAKS